MCVCEGHTWWSPATPSLGAWGPILVVLGIKPRPPKCRKELPGDTPGLPEDSFYACVPSKQAKHKQTQPKTKKPTTKQFISGGIAGEIIDLVCVPYKHTSI